MLPRPLGGGGGIAPEDDDDDDEELDEHEQLDDDDLQTQHHLPFGEQEGEEDDAHGDFFFHVLLPLATIKMISATITSTTNATPSAVFHIVGYDAFLSSCCHPPPFPSPIPAPP